MNDKHSGLVTVNINNIKLDVYYKCEKVNDPLGTGDSPSEYEIEIESVELPISAVDIQFLLDDKHTQEINAAIIRDCNG